MTARNISEDVKQAAIDDYLNSGDTLNDVAARHRVSRASLARWCKNAEEDLAYVGGWHPVGGILRPLLPERRTA